MNTSDCNHEVSMIKSINMDGPTYGHILAELSKPLLGLLAWYFSNILGYKKGVLTFTGITKFKPEHVTEAL